MFNLQLIRIPVVSAVEIGRYLETLGATAMWSGLYEIPPYADDDFARYLTGFRQYVSGSGHWQGSGYSTQNSTYMLDVFSNYVTGYSTGTLLGSGTQFAGYAIMLASGTGVVTFRSDLFTDTFSSYATGTYTGINAPPSFLFGGLTYVDYSSTSGLATGYVVDTKYSGSWTQIYFWENWTNYPTGYQYNPIFISGITTTQVNCFTGYSGTNFYNTGTVISNVFGKETGYIYTTGDRPIVPSFFDTFEIYSTGFYSGVVWTGATVQPTSSITGSSIKTDNSDYTETFIYPVGSISALNSGTWFYDYYSQSYRIINYSGKAG